MAEPNYPDELQKLYIRQERHDAFESIIQSLDDTMALLTNLAELEVPELQPISSNNKYCALSNPDFSNYRIIASSLCAAKSRLELVWQQLTTDVSNAMADAYQAKMIAKQETQ